MRNKNNSYRMDIVACSINEYIITVYNKDAESDFKRFTMNTPQSLYNVQEFMYSLTDQQIKQEYFK